MSMPKAAVYENYCMVLGKNEVWFTRITFITDSVTEAGLEEG
jgi:hypothetical protein